MESCWILKEPQAVKKIIDNLHEDYQKNLRFLPISTYKSLYEVGINIEDYIMKNENTSKNNNCGWKRKKNDNPSSSTTTHSNNDVINIRATKRLRRNQKRK